MIRVLNKDSRSLVYNYISYPNMFFDSFIYFLCFWSQFLASPMVYKEPGQFLSVFDKDLNSNPSEDKLILTKGIINIEKIVDNIANPFYSITSTDVLRLITRLVIHTDTSSMSQLLDLAFKKDHVSFAQEVLGSLDNYHIIGRVLSLDKNIEPLNIINGCAFIVKDLEKFISCVRDCNYNLNAGPQPLRGQVNSINSSLSILDMEYRKSLYNHNNYHSNSGYFAGPRKINREKFSFNNIHMNLGGVRWSSTFLSDRVKSRDDLLQTCFKEIEDILKKKNYIALHVLQREIEDLLFEGQAWFSENNKPNMPRIFILKKYMPKLVLRVKPYMHSSMVYKSGYYSYKKRIGWAV